MKKIKPNEQTSELNRAKYELLKRNDIELNKIKNLLEKNDRKIDELSTLIASMTTGDSPEGKSAWEFLLKHGLDAVEKDLSEYLKKESIPPAVNAVWRWVDYVMELQDENPFKMDFDVLKKRVLKMHSRDSKQIFEELTNSRPNSHLLLGIDLNRNKEVILAEVNDAITKYQTWLGLNEGKKSRLKWLSAVDEFLEVWDLYNKAGRQPGGKTFKQIAKQLNRPLSTVKSQWYAAYEKIYRTPYDPEIKYASEEKRAQAEESLCANCPHGGKCYKHADWIPCSDYLKITGKDKYEFMQENNKFLEYKDGIEQERSARKRPEKSNS